MLLLWRWYRKWRRLLSVMTGGRCHRWKKMMGRGPDGGCGTDERPCLPGSRVPASKSPANSPESPPAANKKPASVDIEFFSQARKALCERSPFDVPEDAPESTTSAASSVSTLPSGLASLLKQSDGRKRHKKSHSGADKKSSRVTERSKGGNIWVETEEYFRDLAVSDIDCLSEISSSLRSLAASKSFLIPCIGNEKNGTGSEENETPEVILNAEDVHNNVDKNLNCEDVNGNRNGLILKDDAEQDDAQVMDIERVEPKTEGTEGLCVEDGKISSTSDSPVGLEWLLAFKGRMILTSERPSKKRKFLGSDAGLEKILIGCPCEGNSSLCDFCCKGEMGAGSNQLIVCSSCKVGVHCKCYGVQGAIEESWLCSWCKQKVDGNDLVKQPCILCPKQGGALKPVAGENADSAVEFTHLFCSLWMPEVYVEDISEMEPIVNVSGIKETRRKLVCNICKQKCGACVRCSHGTCRAAFHPICAREAGHRIEVWGKYGFETVELRAFCSKHSESPDGRGASNLGDPHVAIANVSSVANNEKQHKSKLGQNGDKIAVHMKIHDSSSDKSGNIELQETVGISDSRVNETLECGDTDQLLNMGLIEKSDSEDGCPSDSINFVLILKKLIDRGKVKVEDVAVDIGVSPESLISALGDDVMLPELRTKIVKWLRSHAYMGSIHKNIKVKLKSTILSKTEMGTADHSDDVMRAESDIVDPVAVKFVPPRRRTTSNITILGNDKVICSSDEAVNTNGIVTDVLKVKQLAGEEPGNSSEVSMHDTTEKGSSADGLQESLAADLLKPESSLDNPSDGTAYVKESHAVNLEQSNAVDEDHRNSAHSDVNIVQTDFKGIQSSLSFYVHSSVQKKLLWTQSGLLKNQLSETEGSVEGDMSRAETSSSASVCCSHQDKHSKCDYLDCKSDGLNCDDLVKAKKLGVFELSPIDEVEGEILYFQHRLLDNAVARKHFIDNLICKVTGSLPREIDAAREKKWDAVLVNQYLCDLREAKKQGRKERRHKEAQAVLAAATAAAAASSRISSFRKDTFDEVGHQEKFNVSSGRGLTSSQLMPRAKETPSRVVAPRNSLEKHSDFVQSASDFTKEHARSCDICRRFETILNPILVCSSCKVAVHLDCYRSVKESTGPWQCELCEELLSNKCSGAPTVNFWEKPYFVAECGICGGTTGSFRKSTDGQWVHAFCAEWVFEPTFRRGQVNPVEGMVAVAKGSDVCCICRRKHGVCIKCSYGHCQTTFHPSCARSAGFYMNIKTHAGKLQHKAYCEKHSLEQKIKAETQKHGIEEIKSIKQVRVELERLRLLCERIIKREKIKRDLVLCSHNILACKRDQVARSVLVQSPFFPADVSSESATTSLKGNNTDGYKCYSDAIQKSDDVTVDSTLSVKPRIKVTMSMEIDQKTDDSSTSQIPSNRKPPDRLPFAGKQIPQRSSLASRNHLDDGEWSSKSRKRFETFEKELIMTSDQASMKNQQLPKGYFYVPVDCLPKEKQTQDPNSDEQLEHEK